MLTDEMIASLKNIASGDPAPSGDDLFGEQTDDCYRWGFMNGEREMAQAILTDLGIKWEQ